jgi:hypothetical protein
MCPKADLNFKTKIITLLVIQIIAVSEMGSAKAVMVDDASRPLFQHQLYKGRQPKAGTSATAWRKPKQGRQPQQESLLLQRCRAKRTSATPRTSAAAGCKPQSTYICRVKSCVWRLPKY